MSSTITPGAIPAGAWTAIAKGTGACDIASIPTGYKFLRLILCTTATAPILTFNADGGGNYFWAMDSAGTNSHAESQTGIALTRAGVAFTPSLIDITILNLAAATKHLTGTASCYQGGASQNQDVKLCGSWTNAADEINRITITGGTPVYWALFGAALI